MLLFDEFQEILFQNMGFKKKILNPVLNQPNSNGKY